MMFFKIGWSRKERCAHPEGISELTDGLTTKYVRGQKVPAGRLQKYFDKLTPYGSFHSTDGNVLILPPLCFSLYLSMSPSLPPASQILSTYQHVEDYAVFGADYIFFWNKRLSVKSVWFVYVSDWYWNFRGLEIQQYTNPGWKLRVRDSFIWAACTWAIT